MIKVFEMFAGVGGASFALKKAGIDYECIGYSEINQYAIKIFELNHGKIKNYGDCTKIDTSTIPDFDLLTAGFPCQPFSVNTNQNARGGEHKSANLFMDILRILKYKRPRYILLENVKGIMGDRSKPILDLLVSSLKELGYDLKIKVMNSKNYGTPQNRDRVFFVGKLGHWFGNPIDMNEEFISPKKEKLTMSVLDILETNPKRRIPAITKYILKKDINIKKYGSLSRLDAILQNRVSKNNSNVMFELLDAPSDVVSRQCDRIYDTNFAPCLTATGKDYLFYVNNQVITLTPRECFRLMGFFDDEIDLQGLRDNQKHFLAGNGWDINLVSKIFKKMFKNEGINGDTKTNS